MIPPNLKRNVMIAIGVALAFSVQVRAATIYVDSDHPGGATLPDGSVSNPYRTIQGGIQAARSGDVVRVAAGVYLEAIVMKDGVDVIGDGHAVTTIDAAGLNGSVVTFQETRFSPRLSGFTLTGGAGNQVGVFDGTPLLAGGGIMVLNSAPIITGNVITGNLVDRGSPRGGGIYVNVTQLDPVILDNQITNNVAQAAGDPESHEPDAGQGGGIYVRTKLASPTIADNLIAGNRSVEGGAVFSIGVQRGTTSIHRNVLRDNQAKNGAAIYTRLSAGVVTSVLNNLILGNGTAAGTTDCNDDDPSVGPGQPEICGDGVDNDCDPSTPDLFDADSDGHNCLEDCADGEPSINGAALELCFDGVDNDCDGTADEADPDCSCPDNDGDGVACADCNDEDPRIFPGAPEICGDVIDNDCDPATPDVFDGDGDGFTCLIDCDDLDPLVRPGADELHCDGVDNDCNPETGDLADADGDLFACDEDCDDANSAVNPLNFEFCFDGVDNNCDGFVDGMDPECNCAQPVDVDGDGYRCTDCNDGNPAVNPAANEVCNDGINNDCLFATPDVFDGDGDGYLCVDDCADLNPNVNPGAFENCSDGIDNDCDDLVDQEDDECGCVDADGDGYACEDCNDEDAGIYPGNAEICNDGIDNDCDPETPDLFDNDGDSFTCLEDCRDDDPEVHPEAGENCVDRIDNDCDGMIDFIDPDNPDTVLVAFGSPMRYLPNLSDPGLGLFWTEEFFNDIPWPNGIFGVGYETRPVEGANSLLAIQVPLGTASVYARSRFRIEEIEGVVSLSLGADYDDGVVVWINGVEIWRSPEMPNGQPFWNSDPALHESSNAKQPQYGTPIDVTDVALPLLHEGTNILAVGVYNNHPDGGGSSTDLVLVPRLSMVYGSDDADCLCPDGDEDGYFCADCDDADPTVNPGVPERFCDDVDNDCEPNTPDRVDADGDGYECDVDCDDGVPEISPGAGEILCDFIDNDCNPNTLDLVDGDLDGFVCDCDDTDPLISPARSEIVCDGYDNDCDPLTPDVQDEDFDGYLCDADCDDLNPTISPAAVERCNDGVDNDCDGLTDEEDAADCDCADEDGDGYACENDCDPADPTISPGAKELCNDGIDNDCNPETPDLFDRDRDGIDCLSDCNDDSPFVRPNLSEICDDGLNNDCDPETPDLFDGDGDGFACDSDCNDQLAATFPGAPEICGDGEDNDCDPLTLDLFDEDGDGFDCSIDCEDGLAGVYPGAEEICGDGLDNDCDPLTPDVFDGDGDGYDCLVDCQDALPDFHPDAGEHCGDGFDNDCDGATDGADPGCACPDEDQDGYACDDCEDGQPSIHPGVAEVCADGIDNDCDPLTEDIADRDGDSVSCDSDCDDDDPQVFPGRREICADGRDNDCDPGTVDLFDLDEDGFACDADCDDDDPTVHPGRLEVGCDRVDNDCNPETLDSGDLDADGVQCADATVRGGAISAQVFGGSELRVVNNTMVGNYLPQGLGGAVWIDDTTSTSVSIVGNNILAWNDARVGGGIDHTRFFGELRSNAFHENFPGDLYDAGGSGTVQSSNRFMDPMFVSPPSGNYRLRQASPAIDLAETSIAPANDLDLFTRPFDGDGDDISLPDMGAYEFPSGEVVGLVFEQRDRMRWQTELTEGRFNVYRGHLRKLRLLAAYTQDPELPISDRFCGMEEELPFVDEYLPEPFNGVFYLVTQRGAIFEGTLGHASSGFDRPNDHPCP